MIFVDNFPEKAGKICDFLFFQEGYPRAVTDSIYKCCYIRAYINGMWKTLCSKGFRAYEKYFIFSELHKRIRSLWDGCQAGLPWAVLSIALP